MALGRLHFVIDVSSRLAANQWAQLDVASSSSATVRNGPSRRTHSVLYGPITDIPNPVIARLSTDRRALSPATSRRVELPATRALSGMLHVLVQFDVAPRMLVWDQEGCVGQ
jgi:hypothetical protein